MNQEAFVRGFVKRAGGLDALRSMWPSISKYFNTPKTPLDGHVADLSGMNEFISNIANDSRDALQNSPEIADQAKMNIFAKALKAPSQIKNLSGFATANLPFNVIHSIPE